jgi:acyl carrier protein
VKEFITFEEFRSLIARELHIEESLVVLEASFVENLYADSIRLVEMMLHLAEEGVTIPMEDAWNVKTVGDAYRVYSNHAGLGASPQPGSQGFS